MYADISINGGWLNDSLASNSELFHSITKQPESEVNMITSHTEQMEGIVAIGDTISALTRIARDNGYTIHDVPADDDCLFSSIVYQLQSSNKDKHTLRRMLVSYLRTIQI